MTDESLFHEALALPEAARAAFLEKHCRDRPEARAAIESMLAAHAELGSFLDRPMATRLDPGRSPAPPIGNAGASLPLLATVAHAVDASSDRLIAGRYLLVEKIGEGGMGEVWIARQTEPVRREVALKFIKTGEDVQSIAARFEKERQALAIMDHPNIARVLDGGATPDGQPFFVMELVRGSTMTEYCDANRLTPEKRLELFMPVCQAIQHAHLKGIVHRDIKPSNVLVATYDGKPVPKVIDFGVAKAMGQAALGDGPHTAYGRIVGTPQYMSPEQASLNNLDVDTRSDIYSLGALLYELLTGSPPFRGKDLEGAGVLEALRVIREEEPPRPSTRLSTADGLPALSANRGTDAKTLTGMLRRELDWIVMKALEKDRGRRYQTASDFAADIGRYLSGEPVQAHPPSGVYRVRKLLRRHRGLAVATLAVGLALVVGLIGTSIGLVVAKRAREDESKQRTLATAEAVKAQRAEAETLADFRASADDAIERLIGAKPTLGPEEREYLERALERWKAFAARQSDDRQSRAIRGEGNFRVAAIWERLGSTDRAIAAYREARDVQKLLIDEEATDEAAQIALAQTRLRLGKLLDETGKKDQAVAELQAALETQKSRSQRHADSVDATCELAAVHNALGRHFTGLGKLDDAAAHYGEARDVCARRLGANPKGDVADQQHALLLESLATARGGLGTVLRERAKLEPARVEFAAARDAIKDIADPASASPNRTLSLARYHADGADVAMKLHRTAEAKAGFEAAIAAEKKLVERFPSIPEYRQRLAATQSNLGGLLLSTRKHQEARAAFQAAFDMRQKAFELDPNNASRRRDLALSHFTLAFVAKSLGDVAESRKQYALARQIGEKLVAQFPKVPAYRFELANVLANLGHIEFEAGAMPKALENFQAAMSMQKALVELSPQTPENAVALGGSYCNIGVALSALGRDAECLEWYSKAIELIRPIVGRETKMQSARHFLRNTHCARAQAYEKLGKPALAIPDWDRAVEFSPDSQKPLYRAGLATARMQAGQALEALREVAELAFPPPGATTSMFPAEIWYNFACIYAMAGAAKPDMTKDYHDKSIRLLQRALRSGFQQKGQIATDPHLAPLRNRDDFKKLSTSSK